MFVVSVIQSISNARRLSTLSKRQNLDDELILCSPSSLTEHCCAAIAACKVRHEWSVCKCNRHSVSQHDEMKSECISFGVSKRLGGLPAIQINEITRHWRRGALCWNSRTRLVFDPPTSEFKSAARICSSAVTTNATLLLRRGS